MQKKKKFLKFLIDYAKIYTLIIMCAVVHRISERHDWVTEQPVFYTYINKEKIFKNNLERSIFLEE